METKARIKGLPVWHLRGVSEDAVSVIKDTGFWVHYRSFGLDGWYIAAPDAVLPHLKAALAKKGVSFEGVKHLPRRFGMWLAIPLTFYMMLGWVGSFAPDMGLTLFWVWFAITVMNAVLYFKGHYDGRPVYAEILRPVNNDFDGLCNSADSNHPYTPGTTAWFTYGGGADVR